MVTLSLTFLYQDKIKSLLFLQPLTFFLYKDWKREFKIEVEAVNK